MDIEHDQFWREVMSLKVKIKKLHPDAVVPKYAKAGDAGLDLYRVGEIEWLDKGRNVVTYHTGLAVEIPEGYVGLLFPRSSCSGTGLSLANSVGIIDSGYRGEIMLKYRSHISDSFCPRTYSEGDRIGQLIIMPYPSIEFVEVDELDATERGDGGFGSTGK